MFPAFSRPLAALVALLACLVLVPSASAADGVYTHVVCANPDTGLGVAANGQLPTGMTAGWAHSSAATVFAPRCGAGQTISGSDGMRLTSGSGYTAPSYTSHWLRYRAPSTVEFAGADLYRHGAMSDLWAWSILGATTTNYQDVPRYESCWHNFACTVLGASSAPFAAANRRVLPANDTGGFTAVLACHFHNGPCLAREQALYLYGARVRLKDDLPPAITRAASGELATDEVVAGAADVSLAASDAGAGVYRVIVRVDGVDRVAQIASSNVGRCADVNPANGDAYEFAHPQPCSASTDGIYSFDSTELPDGEHQLVVQVEDAAGKRATAVNRRVVIDNYPPPVAVSAPALSGAPRRGSSLALTPAVFDDHGAPGDVMVERVWQRCRADGSGCADIAGITGLSYTVGDADLNRAIRVVETARNSEGAVESVSAPTPRVVREDGTLPPENNGVDDDGDGVVDEPGESVPVATPSTPPVGVATPILVPGRNGLDGAPGAAGARGVVTSVASAGVVNGDGASPRATLTARFSKGGATGKLRYGSRLTARGRLVDESGRPIRNAIVDIAETPALRGAKAASARPAVTDGNGEFTHTVSGAPGSRSVAFLYRYQRQGAVVAQSTLALRVTAGVKLAVKLKGVVASYSGKVLAGSMPRGGKLVIVQGRAKGGSWQTFASRRATKAGKFKGKYRLKVRRPGKKLQFRVRVISESGWNYGAVTSKAVTRTVR